MPYPLSTSTALLVLVVGSATAADARMPRTIKLHFPRTTGSSGANIETCVFLRVSLRKALDLAASRIAQRSFSGTGVVISHFLVNLYRGSVSASLRRRHKQVVNVVADPTPDDEVCALARFYYAAAPSGPCNVSDLPLVN